MSTSPPLLPRVLNRAVAPLLWLVLALATAAQVFFIARFGDRQIEYEWHILTRNILEHGQMGYHVVEGRLLPSAFMPPLYVGLILAVTHAWGLGQSFTNPESQRVIALTVEVIQLGFALLSAWGVYRLTRLISPHRHAALAASAIFLSMPLVLVQASQISSVSLYLLIIVHLLHQTAAYLKDGRLFRVGLAGALMSLFLVARGEAMLYVPLFLLVIALRRGANRWLALVVFVLASAPAPTALLLRNHAVFGRPASLTISFGYNLYRGYNAGATADGNEAASPALQARLAALKAEPAYELERDRVFRDLAVEQLRANPDRALHLAVRKLIQLWFFDVDRTYPEFRVFQANPLYVLNWWIIVALAGVGLAVGLGRGAPERCLYLGYLLITTGTHVIFFVLPRYRMHLLPVLALFAGVGLVWLLDRVQAAAARSPGPDQATGGPA